MCVGVRGTCLPSMLAAEAAERSVEGVGPPHGADDTPPSRTMAVPPGGLVGARRRGGVYRSATGADPSPPRHRSSSASARRHRRQRRIGAPRPSRGSNPPPADRDRPFDHRHDVAGQGRHDRSLAQAPRRCDPRRRVRARCLPHDHSSPARHLEFLAVRTVSGPGRDRRPPRDRMSRIRDECPRGRRTTRIPEGDAPAALGPIRAWRSPSLPRAVPEVAVAASRPHRAPSGTPGPTPCPSSARPPR